MNRIGRHWAALFVTLLCGVVDAPAQETARDFCDEAVGLKCIPDSFEVVFPRAPAGRASIMEHEEFVPGMRLDVELVLDTRTDDIVGFSYVVRHDVDFLALRDGSVTHEGTILDPEHPDTILGKSPFSVINVVDGAYVIAMIPSLEAPVELPAGRRNVLNRASYSLVGDPGSAGTRIEIVDELRLADGRPLRSTFVVAGESARPETVVDGLIRRTRRVLFVRGDADGNGRLNITDAALLARVVLGIRPAPYACADASDTNDDGRTNLADALVLLQWLFLDGNAPPAPFPDCGNDATPDDALTCEEAGDSCNP